MRRPAAYAVLWLGGLVPLYSACSARSIVIGGDPLGQAGESLNGGGSSLGGSFVSGGVGVGGSGGSIVPTGGTIPTGGQAGAFDPYPPVAWEDGQGYRRSCPHYDEVWGFTCWNYDGQTRSCKLSGDPYCNACSCAVPCDDGCPLGVTGHPSACVASETTAHSCFLVCEDRPCPNGMTCAQYPGADRMVCVWLSDAPFGQPPE